MCKHGWLKHYMAIYIVYYSNGCHVTNVWVAENTARTTFAPCLIDIQNIARFFTILGFLQDFENWLLRVLTETCINFRNHSPFNNGYSHFQVTFDKETKGASTFAIRVSNNEVTGKLEVELNGRHLENSSSLNLQTRTRAVTCTLTILVL